MLDEELLWDIFVEHNGLGKNFYLPLVTDINSNISDISTSLYLQYIDNTST